MIKLAIFALAALAMACSNSAAPVQQKPNARADSPSGSPESVIAHASKDEKPTTANLAPGEKGKWAQRGDPIDTKEFDAGGITAEKGVNAKPADTAAKKALATAYFNRGFALTEARQYASALGDYRRAIKYDPADAKAKEWIDKIVLIYSDMKKEYPREGEEPPPLPFTKGK